MKPIKLYVQEAIDRELVKNQTELAQVLHVSRSAVSDWVVGDTTPNADQAAALAHLLGKPEIMAECMAALAKRPKNRAMWERAAKALRMTSASFAFLAVINLMTPSPANASNGAAMRCTILCYVKMRQGSAEFIAVIAYRWNRHMSRSGEVPANPMQTERTKPRRQKAVFFRPDSSPPGTRARHRRKTRTGITEPPVKASKVCERRWKHRRVVVGFVLTRAPASVTACQNSTIHTARLYEGWPNWTRKHPPTHGTPLQIPPGQGNVNPSNRMNHIARGRADGFAEKRGRYVPATC